MTTLGEVAETRSPASVPPGQRFSLEGFTGRNYDRGRNLAIQILWLASRDLLMKWWCPNAIRVSVLRLFGAEIGTGVSIRHHVKIHWPWKLTVGCHSWIGEDAWILNLEHVTVGSNTCISQGALICSGSHDRRSPTFEFDNAPVTIGDSVWIAARATVLRGVRVGDGATIGATVVVTGDVPPATTLLAAEAQVCGRRDSQGR
jgi:putative colanic acid biosynthesis acetyltransferase WcaF